MHDLTLYLFLCWGLVPLGFFWAGCLCCGCHTILSDTFDRADSTDIGSDWQEVAADWSIASNRLQVSSINAVALCTSTVDAKGRITVVVQLTAVGDVARVILNYTDANNYDYGEIELSNLRTTPGVRHSLWTKKAGTAAQIGDYSYSTLNTEHDDLLYRICTDGDFLQGNFIGLLNITISGRTTNTGTRAGLATGGVLASTAKFNDFILDTINNDIATCPACAECANCKNSHNSSWYRVVITGVTDGTCSFCDSINGTYLVNTNGFDTTLCNAFGVQASPMWDPNNLYNISCPNQFPFFPPIGYAIAVGWSLGTGKVSVLSSFLAAGFNSDWIFYKDYAAPIDETVDGDGECYFTNLSLLSTADNPPYNILFGAQPIDMQVACNYTAATCTITSM